MTKNIVRLAELQETGELPPTAEDAIALTFAERHAHELRYVAAWGRWLAFNGTCWQYDDTLHAFDRARAICREVALDSERSVAAVASAKTVAAVEPGSEKALSPTLTDRGFTKKRNNAGQQGFQALVIKRH